jgi:hypothetical protein
VSRDEISDADIEYIRANYRRLDELCGERGQLAKRVRALIDDGLLPRPSYVLADGSEMVPEDYFRLADEAGGPERLRQEFARRHALAGGLAAELQDDWEGYVGGIYGVCLRTVSPETIVRKAELVASIERLLAKAAPEDDAWRERVRTEVDELDSLERDFSPDYDRHRFDSPPSRDRLIRAARVRYPQLFAEVPARGR